ncbi:hypothetical protein ENBRE01_2257 [Enteropsectra breve]|nr:hypothetical protein ENBRE01_2257 [Enteropsectra breve]
MKILKRVVALVSDNELNTMIHTGEMHSDPRKEELRAMGLTEFEAVNVLNIKPTNLVFLQLIIEDMTERLSEAQLNAIINMFT